MAREIITIEESAPGLPVWGCGCEGITTDTMLVCEDAILTPGDPCPAGRCPECMGLVYLDRPEDRVRDAAPDLLAALRAYVLLDEAKLRRRYGDNFARMRAADEWKAATAAIAKAEGR
jgi:hypothetical protein